MSQSKSVGPAAGAAAALPLTGTNIAMMVLASLAVIVVGLMLLRMTARREES